MDDAYSRRVIGRIAQGDEAAMSELYSAQAQLLYNYAARVLRSADEAEAAVSAVFFSVWSGVPAWPAQAPSAGIVLAGRMRDSLAARVRAGYSRDFRDVDLWSLVAAREFDDPPAEAARRAIGKCGVVSAAVLSLVYFGGLTIPQAGEKLSMTESECRSRLHVCLERLSAATGGEQRAAAHGGKHSACSAALALGALPASDDRGDADHPAEGCPECMSEVARYGAAAHTLPRLLPEVRLPDDMLDKILFSLRLANITRAESGAGEVAAEEPADAGRPGQAAPDAADLPARRKDPGPLRGSGARTAGMFASAAGVLAVGVIALLWAYVRTQVTKIDDQATLIESLQERHTELLLKYDRLAGISDFFESNGVVTLLNGTPEYPGLAGKIVWDTTGRSAMLQILNPPGEFRNERFRISALGENAEVRIAEFSGDDRDSGDVLYRFFPVDVLPPFPAGGFTVDISPGSGETQTAYRGMLQGAVPGRQ